MIGEQLGALLLVVFMAFAGGISLGLLQGFKFPSIGKCFKGYNLKPILEKVRISPILGMIILGCVAKNAFGSNIMDYYPKQWAQWIRMCCLGMVLTRSGL